MNTIYLDPSFDDQARRRELYNGQLVVYSATPSSLALVDLARRLIREAFGDVDPETAQYHMPKEQYASLLSDLKPKFIHHPESKSCIQGLLRELGCEAELRRAGAEPFVTDGGHFIADCSFAAIPDAARLQERLRRITGVVETGLFLGLATRAILGHEDGVTVLDR